MQTCENRQASAGARRAFTLIEMLVVVVIIGVLAGLILHIIRVAGSQNAKAATVTHIEKVRAAVEEFYAEYGQYPPVPDKMQWNPIDGDKYSFCYEYPITNGMPAGILHQIATDNLPWWDDTGQGQQGHVFTFGLMSFLLQRYSGRAEGLVPGGFDDLLRGGYVQWGTNNFVDPNPPPGVNGAADRQRDVNAMRRWSPMISDILWDYQPKVETLHFASGDVTVTNLVVSVLDGWGNELRYRSPAPYQTYDIWSLGPDGQDGGPLAVAPTDSAQAAARKDDIHSSPGH